MPLLAGQVGYGNPIDLCLKAAMQGNPPLGGGAQKAAPLPPALRLEEKLRVLEVPGDGEIVSSPGVYRLLRRKEIVL